eukprot:jgi/Bigna1/89982/estExt_fgenesh1_pg.C_590093
MSDGHTSRRAPETGRDKHRTTPFFRGKILSSVQGLLQVEPTSPIKQSYILSSTMLNVKSERNLHIHFGAGKLGLGLVLGAVVKSGTPLALVQRPSESWNEVQTKCKQIQIRVNEKPCGKPMRVVHGTFTKDLDVKNGPHFVLTKKFNPSLTALVRKASSFSCSLKKGVKGLALVLGRLPRRELKNQPRLYACENDHKAIEELAESLRGRVVIAPCMVDRICTTRRISADEGIVDIGAESWPGQIVVLPEISQEAKESEEDTAVTGSEMDPSCIEPTTMDDSHDDKEDEQQEVDDFDDEANEPQPLPFGGPTVIATDTEAQARYFARRKLLLVNGTHTTLAFLTLCSELEQCETVAKLHLPGKFRLLDYSRASTAKRKQIWAWLVARCCILHSEFDKTVMIGAHKVSSEKEAIKGLLDYAWTTLQRFDDVPDTTARVLSGGVVNRFEGRLRNVLEYLQGLQESKASPPSIVISNAADEAKVRPIVTAEYMQKAIRDLVAATAPMAEEKRKRDAGERPEPLGSPKLKLKAAKNRWRVVRGRLGRVTSKKSDLPRKIKRQRTGEKEPVSESESHA